MKWNELTDKDKVELILKHIYGYYLVESENYVEQTRENRGKFPKDFHWPIAWWDETHEAWGTRDISSNWNTFFDPLQSISDAWEIAERFDEITISKHVAGKYHCGLWRSAKRFGSVGATPQEAICKAALKVYGVNIEGE